MKVSSISLVATCVLMVQGQTPTTAGPTTAGAGPTTYSPPATGSTEGTSNCPRSVIYPGGSQKYRFVEDVRSLAPTQHLPCIGDIANCVYLAHRNFYCMTGNNPEYTPVQLHPCHEQAPPLQNISTYAGSTPPNWPQFQQFSTSSVIYNPIHTLKLFPNVYAHRFVLGGFIMKTWPVDPQDIYKVAYTDVNLYEPPTWIQLTIGEGITEAFGRYGFLIDQVTFGVTSASPIEQPRFYTVGGTNGQGLFDATPPPNLNGMCDLISLSGTLYAKEYIQSLEFLWSCVGKPTTYTC